MVPFIMNPTRFAVDEPFFETDFTECSTNTCSGTWSSNDISDYYIDTTSNYLNCDGGLKWNGMSYAFGSSVSDTAFAMRFNADVTSITTGNCHHGWVLSADQVYGTGFVYAGIVCTADGSTLTVNGATSNFTLGANLDPSMTVRDYFLQVLRTTATNLDGSASSTSAYSGDIGTASQTILSSVINLDNFKANNRWYDSGANINSDVYDITIYDGVTSFP
jgi:hypothetical protein